MTLQQAAGYQNRKDIPPQQATGNYQVKTVPEISDHFQNIYLIFSQAITDLCTDFLSRDGSIDNQPPLFIDTAFCRLAGYPGDQRPCRTELTFHFQETISGDAELGKQVSNALDGPLVAVLERVADSCPRQYFQVNIPSVADAQYPDLGVGDSINDPVIANPQFPVSLQGFSQGCAIVLRDSLETLFNGGPDLVFRSLIQKGQVNFAHVGMVSQREGHRIIPKPVRGSERRQGRNSSPFSPQRLRERRLP